MLGGSIGAVFLSIWSAQAADLPMFTKAPAWTTPSYPGQAVDGLNGKIEALGGRLGHNTIAASQGSISIPLASSYGAQIDLSGGSFGGRGFGHVGGHLFWRDPGKGLLGIYTSYTRWNEFGGVYVGNVAAEGEYYFGRFTLQGIAGVEFGNSVSNTTFASSTIAPGGPGGAAGLATTSSFFEGYDVKTRFFDQINLKYYIGDNWDVFAGHRYQGGKHALALGTEVGMPVGRGGMATAFAEARIGEGDFQGVWGGLRFYFGNKDKTLMKRHREDDPVNWGASNLFSIINNHTTSSGATTTQFCNPGDTLFRDGTCGEPG
ncbi:hypothetical protein [Rhodoplanes sp. Z2-YC6860]|uniref:hypothetical protein n=1 Tax=Rhodoplanes sp. Z2-YC6860 TaxID=674703 RepID=UPI00078B66F5|nr:hypothetical protein [Rhodoplanes sp. Z2-YC6860]AMN40351.1 hypothetical protein RHPLAN_19000 [Rhodoplanes sp. Z2-YC6860]